MSLGRTSTFLDIYLERDIAAGKITEDQAQEMIDHFVMAAYGFVSRTLSTMSYSLATQSGQQSLWVVWAPTVVR